MGYSVECLRTDDILFCHFLNTTNRISQVITKPPWSRCFLRRARPRLRFVRVIAISFSFFGCRREKRHQFWLRHFRRLVYRISIVYAQSLLLRSEELDADTVYSFVPNIGDSDPSSSCTYSKITNGAAVDWIICFKSKCCAHSFASTMTQ